MNLESQEDIALSTKHVSQEDKNAGDTVHEQNNMGHVELSIAPTETEVQVGNDSQPVAVNNKFAALDPEKELQQAFYNLENINNSKFKSEGTCMELVVENEDNNTTCLSDGSGSKDRPNMGVRFVQSAPNSDEDHTTDLEGGTRRRKSKKSVGATRRSTRSVKDRGLGQIYQL